MRRPNLPIAVLAALTIQLCGLGAAGSAMAYNVGAVYKDCETNGQLTGHYSQAQLKAALSQLPAQVSEYSACAAIIQQALVRASSHSGGHSGNSKGPLAGAAGSNGGSGGRYGHGGSGKAAPGARAGKSGTSLTKQGRSAGNGNPVTLAGSGVHLGSTGTGASSSLPVPLLVVLILLALTAVSGGAVAIRRRVVARHST